MFLIQETYEKEPKNKKSALRGCPGGLRPPPRPPAPRYCVTQGRKKFQNMFFKKFTRVPLNCKSSNARAAQRPSVKTFGRCSCVLSLRMRRSGEQQPGDSPCATPELERDQTGTNQDCSGVRLREADRFRARPDRDKTGFLVATLQVR